MAWCLSALCVLVSAFLLWGRFFQVSASLDRKSDQRLNEAGGPFSLTINPAPAMILPQAAVAGPWRIFKFYNAGRLGKALPG